MSADYIDLYCERTAPGLLGEPLNTLGNVAFVVATLWLVRRLLRESDVKRDDWLLVVLAGLVGIGSIAFHLFATRTTALLDQAFIGLFVIVFVQRWLVRVVGIGTIASFAGVVVFVAVTIGTRLMVPREILNGSVFYLPIFLVIASMALWAARRRHPSARIAIGMVAVFIPALVVRTIDLAACDVLPVGTHWLWHVSAAIVVAMACRTLRTGRTAAR